MYGDSAAEGKSGRGGRHGRARPVQLTLFPFLDLVAEDVGVHQPAAGGTAEFAKAETLWFGHSPHSLQSSKWERRRSM